MIHMIALEYSTTDWMNVLDGPEDCAPQSCMQALAKRCVPCFVQIHMWIDGMIPEKR